MKVMSRNEGHDANALSPVMMYMCHDGSAFNKAERSSHGVLVLVLARRRHAAHMHTSSPSTSTPVMLPGITPL
eukprot:648703-Pelagomonas_calceolata.AAC.1